MSCHTWQKFDTSNKYKRFALRGWSARSLGAQWEVGYKKWATTKLHRGWKNRVQRRCLLAKWNKAVKLTSQNIWFHTCFISRISWWNKTATHFVLPAVERQKVKYRNKKAGDRKSHFLHQKMMNILSLSRSQIKIPQALWNMAPHEPSFVLFYSVCSYATLKTKS